MDDTLPVYAMRSMTELIESGTGSYRVYGTFYVAMGLIALFLASTGLYGMLSLDVANSSVDIGIRMAFGAGASQIQRMVLGRGLRQVAAGAALGTVAALWLAHGVRGALFEVEPWNVPVFVGVVLTLAASAGLACYVPARRAARIAPMDFVRGG